MANSNKWLAMMAAGLFAMSVSFAATAQEDDVDLDVVEAEETEGELVNRLELPESASDQGVESSQFGLDTANEAREKGREFGQERALEARESGADSAREASERASAAREAGEAAQEAGDAARDGAPGEQAPL